MLSIQQAKQFGILAKQKLVIPYQIPFLAKEVGAELMARRATPPPISGGRCEDKYPLAKMFVEAFDKKYGYKPEWGANNAYMQFAMWADAVRSAPAPSIRPTSSRPTKPGSKIQSTVGEV